MQGINEGLNNETRLIFIYTDPITHPREKRHSHLQKHHISFHPHCLIQQVLMSIVMGVIIAWMEVSNNGENSSGS